MFQVEVRTVEYLDVYAAWLHGYLFMFDSRDGL